MTLNNHKSVCIEDMNGGGRFPTAYWADWYPELLTTYFGGDWWFVPPLHTQNQPDEETFNHWVEYHENMF